MINACLKLYSNGNESAELFWIIPDSNKFDEGMYDLILNLTEKTVTKNNIVDFKISDQNTYSTLIDYLKTNFPSINFVFYENASMLETAEWDYLKSSFPLVKKVEV